MARYDIAIIGTGPGGVSAALTAKNRNKSILLIGSKRMSEKVEKAHEIRNYPGLPFVKGEDMAAAFRDQLEKMEIPVTETRIGAVYAMGDYFALQAGEEMLEAETVILATGVVQAKPLPGEEELLGHGVSYCATCDAPLYRGKTTAVIGYGPREEEEAAFLSEVCSKVRRGGSDPGNPEGNPEGRKRIDGQDRSRGIHRRRRVCSPGSGGARTAGARPGNGRGLREGQPQNGNQYSRGLCLRGYHRNALPVCEGGR